MVFVVLEGFSGTGKTTLAKGLETRGWLRLKESAHAVPREVPVAERADTFADFSLMGSTLVYSSLISSFRGQRDIVSEGYLLSDLAYAKIRLELKKSTAFPAMLDFARRVLSEPSLAPDLYIILQAAEMTIGERQLRKDDRERNVTEFFRTRYYSALDEIHSELGQGRTERLQTDGDPSVTLEKILELIRVRKLTES